MVYPVPAASSLSAVVALRTLRGRSSPAGSARVRADDSDERRPRATQSSLSVTRIGFGLSTVSFRQPQVLWANRNRDEEGLALTTGGIKSGGYRLPPNLMSEPCTEEESGPSPSSLAALVEPVAA